MTNVQRARPAAGLFAHPRSVRTLGDLLANVWQLGYVADDLDEARTMLEQQFGIEHAVEIPTEGATAVDASGTTLDWGTRVLFAARGGMIVEVIEPTSGQVEWFRRPLDGRPGLRLHHLATYIPSGEESWESMRGVLADAGLPIDYTVTLAGHVRAGYIDTTALLGHWLEVCQLEAAEVAFFEGLARESAG